MDNIPLPGMPHGSSGHDTMVRRSVLPGGIRVLTEQMPGLRSAAVGLWLDVGSRDETDGHFGSTHFLEHLLFKGTTRRNAIQLSQSFDSIGAEVNAVTDKEHTLYYAKCVDTDFPVVLDTLLDMVTDASLRDQDVDVERTVIIDELAMAEDDLNSVAHEGFISHLFGTHPLGRPVGAWPRDIEMTTAQSIREHYNDCYVPPSLVVTAAGGIQHETVVDLVMQSVESSPWELDVDQPPKPRRPITDREPALIEWASGVHHTVRPSEQAHIIIGGPGTIETDSRRAVLTMLHTILGGGMSSRLMQEIRERRGLAYSVYSFSHSWSDAGAFGLYAGCAPQNVDSVAQLLDEQWEQLATSPVSEAELTVAVGHVSGGLVLGLEDSSTRMVRLGRSEISTGEYVDVDEALRRIHAVTPTDIQLLAQELYQGVRSTTCVGPRSPR